MWGVIEPGSAFMHPAIYGISPAPQQRKEAECQLSFCSSEIKGLYLVAFCYELVRHILQMTGSEVCHPFSDGLVAALGLRIDGAVDAGQEAGMVSCQKCRILRKLLGCVVDFALASMGKTGAGESVIKGGSQSVDVCPWTHVAICCALFRRAEARGFHNIGAEVAICLACGAEVDDNRETCAGDDDVVWFDIPVE